MWISGLVYFYFYPLKRLEEESPQQLYREMSLRLSAKENSSRLFSNKKLVVLILNE